MKAAMNRKGTIFSALRFSSSLLSSPNPVTRQLLTQVTQFSPISLLFEQSHTSYCFDPRQKLYFSSKPSTILVQLLLENDWSTELETELENSNPILSHETVIYVLKNLYKDPQKAWGFFNWVSKRDEFKPSSSLYSLLLRILANNNSVEYFWITLWKMKEQGFYISEGTYLTILSILKKENMYRDAVDFKHFVNRMLEENMDSVVKSVVTVILGTEWDNEVEKQLGDMGIVLTDDFVISVLNKVRDSPVKALRFFCWVCNCEAYECNTVTYNAMARFLARDDSIGEFWSVIDEMKSAGHELDFDTFTKVSRQFQKNKLFEDAVKLYEFMMDSPFRPSVQDCSILLRSISASDAPDLSLVKRVVSKYEATGGSSLSKAIYDGMHRCFIGAGKFDDAENIRNDMKNAGYEPDNITYNQLVFGLCKAKKLEEAHGVFNEMEAHGCVPDIKTWTLLIQGYCTANEVDMALRCLAEMREKNLNAGVDLLDALINALLSEKRIDEAYALLVEMVSKGQLRHFPSMCKVLTEKLLIARKIEQAFTLLHLMRKRNHRPLLEPFVEYISQFGTVENAANFLKIWNGKECPSTFAYLHIFRSFFEEGRHFEAKYLLYMCPRHIVEHPEISELFGSAKSGDAAS